MRTAITVRAETKPIERAKTSEEIARDTRIFLSYGGKITNIKQGITGIGDAPFTQTRKSQARGGFKSVRPKKKGKNGSEKAAAWLINITPDIKEIMGRTEEYIGHEAMAQTLTSMGHKTFKGNPLKYHTIRHAVKNLRTEVLRHV